METTFRILKYFVAAVAVALLGVLASWYYYVRAHQASIAKVEAGRDLGAPPPVYGGTLGSTAGDIARGGSTTPVPSEQHPLERLWRADEGPVAGFSFVAMQEAATTTALLYFAERASGNVFAAEPAQQRVVRLTNTLIPKTYEAVFAPRGGAVLIRTLQGDAISTLLATFATPSATTTFPLPLGGPALAPDIRDIAIDPDPKSAQLFYLAKNSRGGTAGFLSSLRGAKPKQIFSSTIASWRAMIAGGRIVLLESPGDGLPGYAYTLSNGGTLSLLAGPLPGLMVLPHPTEQALLFSSSNAGRLSLYAQVGKREPVLLPIATIAEKCAWAPGASLIAYCAAPQTAPPPGFIDLWYQGASHTSDSWWVVDAASGNVTELFTPAPPLDVQDAQVDPSGNYIAFENGADLSLWILRIMQ